MKTAFRRQRVINWSEIRRIRFKDAAWQIETQSQGTLRLRVYMTGVGDFINMLPKSLLDSR